MGQVVEGQFGPLSTGSHSGYHLEFPHSLGSPLGGQLGALEALRDFSLCSQAHRCHLSWGALTTATMQRAGLQRTCPQRPHGGFETLCLRSELKIRSCQWPQGRESLLDPASPPPPHTCGCPSGGHERGHLFLWTYAAAQEDRALPGACLG